MCYFAHLISCQSVVFVLLFPLCCFIFVSLMIWNKKKFTFQLSFYFETFHVPLHFLFISPFLLYFFPVLLLI